MYLTFETEAQWMYIHQKPKIYNQDDWGFEKEVFKTTEI
jgi:hypothetical protein